MSSAEFRIDKITVGDLWQFYSSRRDAGGVLPICRCRALAQSRNPYADPDDPALLIAYTGTDLVGYLGLLPGILKIGQQREKVYWFSGWFVDPRYRSTALGSMLLMRAFSLKRNLFMTGLSHHSEDVFRALRLPELGPLSYSEIRLSWLVDMVTIPLRSVRRLLRILHIEHGWLDRLIARSRTRLEWLKVVLWRRLTQKQEQFGPLYFEEISELPAGMEMVRRNAAAVFYRGPEIINWMMQHPWIPGSIAASADQGYAFLVCPDRFKYVALNVYSSENRQRLGFMVMAVSSSHSLTTVRLLDYALDQSADYRWVVRGALKYARFYGADLLQLPDQVAQLLGSGLLIRLIRRSKVRTYFYYVRDKRISRSLQDVELNIYDGDVAFTPFG